MSLRFKWLFLPILFVSLSAFSLTYGQNRFRLKPGASGKLCLSCHENFLEKLKSPFVHTPVKTGECSGCHNPHTSSHGKLLSEDASQVCLKCHGQVIPSKAKSRHKIAFEGQCIKCHDPHASNQKFLLLRAGNELCFSCHKAFGDAVAKVKFKHHPVEKGCLSCHDAHGSDQSAHLLKKEEVALCLSCHRPDRANFAKQHMNYPVSKARCTSCHDPHGSDRGGILFANVHMPVANKACHQCHEAAASAAPFKTKKSGYELCRGCHSSMMNETLNKNRVHWPLLDQVGCLNCHEPHASTQKRLLSGDSLNLCGKCHSDTIARQEKSPVKHDPVKEGNCGLCHSPHGSDHVLLMKKSSSIELCGGCHDWQKHSTHPIGEKVVDSRNRNITMDCLSCHRSHGTEFKWMLTFKTTTELCVQCHKQYKR